MTTSSQKPSPAYQSCLDEGVKQASELIEQWCARMLDALSARSLKVSERSDRHPVYQAKVALMRNRMVIGHDFVMQLKQAVAGDALLTLAKKTDAPARTLSTLSFDALELMGERQVQETVERARLLEIVTLTCDAALSGFSARLSRLQGFQMVKTDKNPLRPDIVVQALLNVLEGLLISPEVRSCLLKEGARILGEELQSLYLSMDAFLARQGVTPAAYGVIFAHETGSERVPSFSQDRLPQRIPTLTPMQHAREAVDAGKLAAKQDEALLKQKKLLTLDHLHHLLAGDYEALQGRNSGFSSLAPAAPAPAAQEAGPSDFSPTLPAAMDVLVELEEKKPGTVTGGKERPAPSLPVAQLRAHLKTESTSLGQSLAVEVVGLMIEQLAHDERLLMPVRQIIANAESAFLRLAVTDTRFFSNTDHPARKLLDVITSTSLGYASEEAPGFTRFMQNLQAMAPMLTEEHAGDAQHFATLLQEFEGRQTRSTPEYLHSQRLAVQTLLQVEQRNLLAVKIAGEIKARADFVPENRIVADFLTGPWAQVIAKEQLLARQAKPIPAATVFNLTLDDLLWSLNLEQVAGQRQRLLQMIPGLLKSLRAGLVSIHALPDQFKDLFNELMTVHQAGLRTQASAPIPLPTAATARKLDQLFDKNPKFSASKPWLAPAEARNSGFMGDLVSSDSDAPEAAQPAPTQEVKLPQGAWVEMLVDAQWLRAQLTWVSPLNTLYMFTSEGGRKHSMTARVLHHLLKLEFVKVVSDQGVLERALDRVTRTAMRNSVDGDSGF